LSSAVIGVPFVTRWRVGAGRHDLVLVLRFGELGAAVRSRPASTPIQLHALLHVYVQ
jgi:hypothetical protein